jgi:hypothetical protein
LLPSFWAASSLTRLDKEVHLSFMTTMEFVGDAHQEEAVNDAFHLQILTLNGLIFVPNQTVNY